MFDGKGFFVLKMYDLTITNVYLMEISSNHKAMFSEYSKNIPWIFVSKIFQGYPRIKYCFVGYPVKFLTLEGSLLFWNVFL